SARQKVRIVLAQVWTDHPPLHCRGVRIDHEQQVQVAQRQQHVAGREHRERRCHRLLEDLDVVEVREVAVERQVQHPCSPFASSKPSYPPSRSTSRIEISLRTRPSGDTSSTRSS